METNLSLVVHGRSESLVDMKMGEGKISTPLVKVGSDLVKGNKASPSLGILQKDQKK